MSTEPSCRPAATHDYVAMLREKIAFAGILGGANVVVLLPEDAAAIADHLAALQQDRDRLDVLEREAHIEPLVLHDGRQDSIGGLRGLGLMPGFLRRPRSSSGRSDQCLVRRKWFTS